jgi:2,3-bisphosphoglycerate-independent phosphoglycerate mutase
MVRSFYLRHSTLDILHSNLPFIQHNHARIDALSYRILFVFLDGVGLGSDDPAQNPLAASSLPAFERLADGQPWTQTAHTIDRPDHLFRAIDATLGVDGLPQSGTGQATLLTGVNCARIAGRHYGPYPHSQTRPVLASRNIFTQIQALGLPFYEPAVFANAYPDRFFSYVRKTDRWTVTTRCCLDAGLRIRTHQDVLDGHALTADLTAEGWPQADPAFSPISEEEAGRRLARLSGTHAFTLFEYFLSDKAGHSQSMEHAAAVLQALDRFFTGLLATFDLSTSLLIVTSDHGNLEDLSTKSHTRNAVPLIAYGREAASFAAVRDLTGVTPAIVETLRERMEV